MQTFSRYFMGTMFFALILSILMFLFWPPLPVEEKVVLAFEAGECPAPEIVQIPVPFPIYVPAERDVGSLECWYFDRLDDWMCPVPAGAPWN